MLTFALVVASIAESTGSTALSLWSRSEGVQEVANSSAVVALRIIILLRLIMSFGFNVCDITNLNSF
ncbi:hypothetical protein D3C85_1947220 [compost metagenome]